MAEAMTYSSLLTDVRVYAERDDSPFIDQIPRFVMLAENRLAQEVHGLGFIKVVSGTLSTSNPVMAKPARWRETVSLSYNDAVNGWTYIRPRSYEFCRSYNPSNTAGTPKYYADYDFEHFYISPRPSLASAFELIYHERPEPLDTANQTNWITQYAPQLLLYATLLEAQPFLKLTDRQQVWQAMYDRAVQALANESNRRMTDSTIARKTL